MEFATGIALFLFTLGSITVFHHDYQWNERSRISVIEEDLQDVVYRGAVVEMVPPKNHDLSPLGRMSAVVQMMHNYSRIAKEQEADIIVFPEYVLYSYQPFDRHSIRPYTQYIPDVNSKVSPCDLKTLFNHDSVIRGLSWISKELNMYLVANIPEREHCLPDQDSNCPDDKFYFYNTNVVFDRQGKVVNKYRKRHLFAEPFFNIGNTPDEGAIFTTDFKVTFTQHICFDIFFHRPTQSNIEKYGVKDVIMPTSWIDYSPFVIAPQLQYGYSRGTGVNLLVAGRHMPNVGAVGSGIFTGASDINNSVYVYNDTQGTQLLVHDVKTKVLRKSISKSSTPVTLGQRLDVQSQATAKLEIHRFLYEDLSGFFHYPLKANSSGSLDGTYRPLEEAGVSITYHLEWVLEGDSQYHFVLSSGTAGFGEYLFYRQVGALLYCPSGEQSCGKVPSDKSSKDRFLYFNMTLTFDAAHAYPSVLDQDFALIAEDKWTYTSRKEGDRYIASMATIKPIDHLFAATINGRMYGKDPYCETHVC